MPAIREVVAGFCLQQWLNCAFWRTEPLDTVLPQLGGGVMLHTFNGPSSSDESALTATDSVADWAAVVSWLRTNDTTRLSLHLPVAGDACGIRSAKSTGQLAQTGVVLLAHSQSQDHILFTPIQGTQLWQTAPLPAVRHVDPTYQLGSVAETRRNLREAMYAIAQQVPGDADLTATDRQTIQKVRDLHLPALPPSTPADVGPLVRQAALVWTLSEIGHRTLSSRQGISWAKLGTMARHCWCALANADFS